MKPWRWSGRWRSFELLTRQAAGLTSRGNTRGGFLTASVRRAADVPAVQDAVTTGDDVGAPLPPWLALRPMSVSAVPVASKNDQAKESQQPKLSEPHDLLRASVQEVLLEAISLAYGGVGGKETQWVSVLRRLQEVELSAEEAFLVFHCMVKLGDWNHHEVFERMVDRIECHYFSLHERLHRTHVDAWDERLKSLLRAFEPDEDCSFQSLVNHLPLSHKIPLILIHSNRLSRGGAGGEAPIPVADSDGRRAWKTVDPVEMEEWERERFFKGRIKVRRMPSVTAKVQRMAPGKRLRAILASQLFQVLPQATAPVLAEISQVCFFEQRFLTGDLEFDFREAVAKRIGKLERHELLPYILCSSAALRRCSGPESYRAFRKRILPDLLWLMRATKCAEILQNQKFVKPLLQMKVESRQHELAELCARLMISVCGARQIQMDVEMLDALSKPLEEILADAMTGPEDVETHSILSTETLADLLSVLVTCRVAVRPEFMELLATATTLGTQVWQDADFADLCVVANALSLLHPHPQASLQILWTAALPRLATTSTASHALASRVALLDALLRGADDELLLSEAVRSAMDEFMVQRVDLDLSALGHIGS